MKKPKYREKCLKAFGKSLLSQDSKNKIRLIKLLDDWSVVTDGQIKDLLECANLSKYEQDQLKSIIMKVGAYKPLQTTLNHTTIIDNDIPF